MTFLHKTYKSICYHDMFSSVAVLFLSSNSTNDLYSTYGIIDYYLCTFTRVLTDDTYIYFLYIYDAFLHSLDE